MVRTGKYPELASLFAIPNGGMRSKATAGKLKAEGVKPGVSDLMLPVARGGHHGLFVEMKSATGALSKLQDQWLADMATNGYAAHACWGFEQARAVIEGYLGGGV